MIEPTEPGAPEQAPEHAPKQAPEQAAEQQTRGASRVIFGPLAVLALFGGVVIGMISSLTVPDWLAPYLPIAVVAALDALFGGVRAWLDRIFDAKVFVVSFIANVIVAALIVFLGDQLGVGSQLSTAVVVVLGIRIFANVAAIRRRVFKA